MIRIQIGIAAVSRQERVYIFLSRYFQALHQVRAVKAVITDINGDLNTLVLGNSLALNDPVQDLLVTVA